MAILKVDQLIVDYGIIRALKGVNLKVEKGQIVAILGANGAGKSSLIRTIAGLVKTKSGSIILEGENITNKDSFKITAKGVMSSPEGRMILAGLTVEENLLVGAYALKNTVREVNADGVEVIIKRKVKDQIKEQLEEVYNYFPILKERKKQQASTLSGGEQQMLAIGRALMGKPKLLLLDEPSLGLAPLIVKNIFDIILKIKERGNTILIVEQNAYQTLKIADYAYLFELGHVKKEGTGEEFLRDEELITAYLGTKK